MKAMQQLGN